ncbi:MAG: hypothetical protein L6243_04200 [Candidatus Altiarchaeales archaeon]|nr:hypothetical protein [Candidatus Altiarchaeota archaeon]MBU4437604.1 hypothetical protein [Candidatus Altiarchaeota archaeon]MCG2782771.1 hypothetical protein [Candidatus Altiarchaeales archaeon]
MSSPVLAGLERLIYIDITNILSLLGALYLWLTFITFSLVSRRYSKTFKEKTHWQFLVLFPLGLLLYITVQAYDYGFGGGVTPTVRLISYLLMPISGFFVLIATEKFADLNERLNTRESKKSQLKLNYFLILVPAFVVLLMLILGIWVGTPLLTTLAYMGFIFLAMALLRYSLIVRSWVMKMKKPMITWQLLFIGVISIIVAVIFHMVGYSQSIPYMDSNLATYYWSFNCRTIAFSFLAIGGILASIGGWLFYEMKLLKKY